MDFAFKPTKKLNHDILGSLNKSKTPSHCRFPLSNLHKGQSLHIVPISNLVNKLILLYICSANPNKICIKLQVWLQRRNQTSFYQGSPAPYLLCTSARENSLKRSTTFGPCPGWQIGSRYVRTISFLTYSSWSSFILKPLVRNFLCICRANSAKKTTFFRNFAISISKFF